MSRIVAVETSLPEMSYSQDEIQSVVANWLETEPERHALISRFIRSSKNTQRSFAIPAKEIIKLKGLEQRSELFEKFAPQLGCQAASSVMAKAQVSPSEINNFIFTSCSCPAIPSVDAIMIDRLEMARNVKRLPIYQHGCAGGVVGLSLAKQISSNSGLTLFTAVEICSLIFQKSSASVAQLVGASIFADGAAAVLIDDQKLGLQIKACESYLIPETRDLMGYDIFDDGFHLRLKRELPSVLAQTAPKQVDLFLKEHDLTRKDIGYWLFHPGGLKILDSLEQNLEITPEQCHWSRDLLFDTGNLSSASVLFVLKRFLDSTALKAGDKIIMLGVGPGLTLELILMEYQG